MDKKTRRIILIVCTILFLIITPYVIVYSLGYRVDLQNFKLVGTGGIYVKALPQGVNIIIDSAINNRTGALSYSIFDQNLLPGTHRVLIQKDGYYDYQKSLEIKENEVTKLENVILFKKNIPFEIVTDTTQSPFKEQAQPANYIIKNNNLYDLETYQTTTPIIENIVAYTTDNGDIIWLGLDGLLHKTNLRTQNMELVTQTPIAIQKNTAYELGIFGPNIFLKTNTILFILNPETKAFQNFYTTATNMKISPDGQKLLYYNDHEILFSFVNQGNPTTVFLNRFSEKITDCQWLGNDYIIFKLADKILVSEIDNRGNINTVNITGSFPTTTNITSSKILFNQQDKKLYFLVGENVYSSEKIIP